MSGHNVKRPFIFSVRSFFSCLLYHFSLCSLPLLLLYILLLILFLSLDSPFSMPNFLHISIPFLLLPVLLHIFFLFPSTLHILLLVIFSFLFPSYSIIYSSSSLPLFMFFPCSCCLSPPFLFCALPLSLIRTLIIQSQQEITEDLIRTLSVQSQQEITEEPRNRKYTDTRGLVIWPVHNIGIIPLCL